MNEKNTQVSQKHTFAMCSTPDQKSKSKTLQDFFFLIFPLHLTNLGLNASFKIRFDICVGVKVLNVRKETFNPTHFQEAADYFFFTTSWSQQDRFPVSFEWATPGKITRINFFLLLLKHVVFPVLQSEKSRPAGVNRLQISEWNIGDVRERGRLEEKRLCSRCAKNCAQWDKISAYTSPIHGFIYSCIFLQGSGRSVRLYLLLLRFIKPFKAFPPFDDEGSLWTGF